MLAVLSSMLFVFEWGAVGVIHKPLPRLIDRFRHVLQLDILPHGRCGKIGISGRLRIGAMFGIQTVKLYNIRRGTLRAILPPPLFFYLLFLLLGAGLHNIRGTLDIAYTGFKLVFDKLGIV